MDLQTLLDNLLGLVEVAAPDVHHDGFKLYFPLAFVFVFGLHYYL